MPSASDDIRAAIEAAGGAIRFDEFMRLALYGEHGFYAGSGRAGRRGDFLTSPEVGPLFGAVVARFLDAEWERLGRPDPFTVVEAGAGPGTLARAVIAARPACAAVMRYVAVEVSDPQRAEHPDPVESAAEPPAGPVTGVVLANELLDNLPFRLAVYDGAWRDSYVANGPDETFVEILGGRVDDAREVLPVPAAHGARAPLQDAAVAWVAAARTSLRAGRIVVFDYCSTTDVLAGRPYRDWLRTYRGHDRGGHYLAAPGTQDITVEVAVDQLPPPDVSASQAVWLRRWGIDALVADGKRVWRERAAAPDLAALRMRSRIAEAEALLDERGLGAFRVLEWLVPGVAPAGASPA